MTTRLILVGGFLGTGKTTLLWQAARGLASRGKRVGLITNDQAPDLVDTGFLAEQGFAVREVTGSCFCCNFAGLISAADDLARDIRANVLIAEPVGSCTDLSATILQPLKDKFAREFVLAPFSVLADAVRLREVLTHTCDTLHANCRPRRAPEEPEPGPPQPHVPLHRRGGTPSMIHRRSCFGAAGLEPGTSVAWPLHAVTPSERSESRGLAV